MNKRQTVVNEIHKPVRRNFVRRHTVIKSIDDLWQIDLVDMTAFSKENENYKYLLTVIDCFSKYAWATPLTDKMGYTVSKVTENIFTTTHRFPHNLHTDKGKEFYNNDFRKLMKKYNINHYSTFTHIKAGIIERFNRTLKEKMWKKFSMQGSYNWINIHNGLLDEYNNSYHSTKKMKPSKVSLSNEKQIFLTCYNHPTKIVTPKYKIGDLVRISKYKTIFEKGYTPNWTTEIFKICNINVNIQ